MNTNFKSENTEWKQNEYKYRIKKYFACIFLKGKDEIF
jgi:hypothetical protein